MSKKKGFALFAGYLVFCLLNILFVYYCFPVVEDRDLGTSQRMSMLTGVIFTLNNHILVGGWILVFYHLRAWRRKKKEHALPEQAH